MASAQQEEKGEISKIEVNRQNKNIRLVGLIWIIILLLVLGGIGLDSIFSQPPEVKTTTPTYKITQTPRPLTETGIPKVFTATIEPTPTLGIGSTMISEKDGMVMVYVPAGEFTMGSDSNSDEQPIGQVNLDAFWIDQTEVTNVMYAQCVKNSGCTLPSSESSFSHNSYYGNPEFDNYPVIYVDWNQAKDYCSWVGRKLPSEAEWEKAARGTDQRTYPWGEEIDCDISNFNFKCFGDTTKVGNYLDGASLYGTFDMAGNVWEWVSSLYLPYPYDEKDGREDLTASGSRALRGGSWSFNVIHARSANRNENAPIITDDDIGFRCSLSQP